MFGDDESGVVEGPEAPMDTDGACRARTGDPQLAKCARTVATSRVLPIQDVSRAANDALTCGRFRAPVDIMLTAAVPQRFLDIVEPDRSEECHYLRLTITAN